MNAESYLAAVYADFARLRMRAFKIYERLIFTCRIGQALQVSLPPLRERFSVTF